MFSAALLSLGDIKRHLGLFVQHHVYYEEATIPTKPTIHLHGQLSLGDFNVKHCVLGVCWFYSSVLSKNLLCVASAAALNTPEVQLHIYYKLV